MTYAQLMAALYEVQHGFDIVVLGRRETKIGATINRGDTIPDGWRIIPLPYGSPEGYIRITRTFRR